MHDDERDPLTFHPNLNDAGGSMEVIPCYYGTDWEGDRVLPSHWQRENRAGETVHWPNWDDSTLIVITMAQTNFEPKPF